MNWIATIVIMFIVVFVVETTVYLPLRRRWKREIKRANGWRSTAGRLEVKLVEAEAKLAEAEAKLAKFDHR